MDGRVLRAVGACSPPRVFGLWPLPATQRRASLSAAAPPADTPERRRRAQCGHCKAFAPVWEEVGTKLDAATGVKFAKVDATAESASAAK